MFARSSVRRFARRPALIILRDDSTSSSRATLFTDFRKLEEKSAGRAKRTGKERAHGELVASVFTVPRARVSSYVLSIRTNGGRANEHLVRSRHFARDELSSGARENICELPRGREREAFHARSALAARLLLLSFILLYGSCVCAVRLVPVRRLLLSRLFPPVPIELNFFHLIKRVDINT